MKNALDKIIKKIKTYILHSVTFFFENRVVYGIMSKIMVEMEGPQMTLKYDS
jgi:hypothetical protein